MIYSQPIVDSETQTDETTYENIRTIGKTKIYFRHFFN